MSTIVEKDGVFYPSKLQAELREAGVIGVLGITHSEDEDGNVTAVQIILDTDTPPMAEINAVCAAHDPTPTPATEVPTPESILLNALDSIDTATLATPADVVTALRANLA